MRRGLSIYLGGGIIALLLIATLAAPLLSPQDPYEMQLSQGLEAPETAHPFGRDKLGRDILSRVLHGGRTSLTVGFAAVSISVLLGVIIGGIAGYLGGVWDEAIMRVTDVFLAFPGILLAIALMSVLAPSLWNIVISLSVFGWVGYARLVRAQVLALREREFVIAARAAGATPGRILTFGTCSRTSSPRSSWRRASAWRERFSPNRDSRSWDWEFSRPNRVGGRCWPRGETSCSSPRT